MRRVSVTEIIAWRHCRLLWHYRYQLHLQSKVTAPQLLSGTVVHAALQASLSGEIGRGDMAVWSKEALLERGGDLKYLPGIVRALGKAPDWLWETEGWHVEEKYEVDYSDHDVIVVGIPDLFRLENDVLTIVEFKTTETDPIEFLLWNPQHRYYAALLAKNLQPKVIAFQYICLPTSAQKAPDTLSPFLLSEAALKESEREMLDGAAGVGQLPFRPNYSRACSFCEFAPIDTARIVGGDPLEVMKEYDKK